MIFFFFCQRQHEKKSIYNLNEDEELTHYGQSLADVEKHNDIVDSDSDAEERGALSGKGREWGQSAHHYFLPALGDLGKCGIQVPHL